MKLIAQITVWGCIAALGAVLAWGVVTMRWLTADQLSGLLSVLAVLTTLATAALGILVKNYETAPPKELSSRRARNMEKEFIRRRKLMFRRYILSLISGVVGGCLGWGIKNTASGRLQELGAALSGALLMCMLVMALLAVYEAYYVGNVLRDLRVYLERKKDLHESRDKLRTKPEDADKAKA